MSLKPEGKFGRQTEVLKGSLFAALTGKDVATSVEVFWPDGRSVARPLEPGDMNKVMEIHYPENEEEVTPAAEIEVHTLSAFLVCSFSLKDGIVVVI